MYTPAMALPMLVHVCIYTGAAGQVFLSKNNLTCLSPASHPGQPGPSQAVTHDIRVKPRAAPSKHVSVCLCLP